MTDPLREALERIRDQDCPKGPWWRCVQWMREQARAALAAPPALDVDDETLSRIRSHAFGPCLVCGAHADDPEAFETCVGPRAVLDAREAQPSPRAAHGPWERYE